MHSFVHLSKYYCVSILSQNVPKNSSVNKTNSLTSGDLGRETKGQHYVNCNIAAVW